MARKRRSQNSADSTHSEKRFIPIPAEFTGLDEQPWTFTLDQKPEEIELLDVLTYTARFCRPRADNPSPGDANRLLGFCDLFQATLKAEGTTVEMSRNDFEWMIGQFKDHGHKVWNPVDNAFLVRWLERNTQTTPIKEDEDAAPVQA